MSPIVEERLELINRISLKSGAHSPGSTFCVMEAVAYVAGEPWSDAPECACPVISAFLRSWDDGLPSDAERDRLLKPLIIRLVGTRKDTATEKRRALMAADWLVRVNTPAWLRLAGLTVHADALSALPEITSLAQVPSIRGPIEAARVDTDTAWDTAWDAARAAAWDTAWDAARAAAWDAAWAAARAAARAAATAAAWDTAWDTAWDAARAAAWDTAWDTAWDAARAAAWDTARAAAWDTAWDTVQAKFAATVEELQQSALKLVERMIDA